MRKYRYPILLSLVLLFAISCWAGLRYHRHIYRKSDGFSASAIQFSHPFHQEWEAAPLSSKEEEKIAAILGKRFFYLSKGARSYAFESEDGEHVLKFFKYRYAEPHWTVRYLPRIQPFEYFRQKKINKVSLDTVLTGYKIAYDMDPEGTGVLYIHLNPAPGKLPAVVVADKEGRAQRIDLNQTRFVLQKKATELGKMLKRDLDEGDTARAKEHLILTMELYLSHFRKGIYDLGTGLVRNNGFIEENPVHFDVGKMTFDQDITNPEFQYLAMVKLWKNGDKWLAENYPEYRGEVSSAMKDWMSQAFDRQGAKSGDE